MWIRTTSNTSGGKRELLIDKFNRGTPNYDGYALAISNNKLHFYSRNGGSTNGWSTTYSTATVNDGNWHHVAVSFDGTNGTYYIDGQASGSVSVRS